MKLAIVVRTGLTLAAIVALASLARAEMVLSQVIVDLSPGKPAHDDIEVFNDGSDRMYVSAEPFEILKAGTANEQRVPATNPEQSSLLVSPQKVVLAPGERRTIRIAMIGDRPSQDRIYRVSIKPVAGPITADQNALKLFVGYDTLVLVRPQRPTGGVVGERAGKTLVLRSEANTATELFDGRQCSPIGQDCRSLPSKRLYAGNTWQQVLPFDTPVVYRAAVGPAIRELHF